MSPRDTDKDEGLGAKPSSKHRILWVDGVGGFLMVDKEEIVIGQATSSSKAEVAIVGDLSRQAAASIKKRLLKLQAFLGLCQRLR